MVETTYTKSKATDFGGNLKTGKFHKEIVAEGGIAPTLLRVDTVDDVVDIVFDAALSGGEQTTLTTLIGNHDHTVPVTYNNVSKISLKNETISTSTYKRFGTFIYPGSNHTGTIAKICGIGHMDIGVTSYSIKVDDKTNGTTIAVNTFTDTTEGFINLGTVSNIPTEEAMIEICVKKTGGTGNKKAYLDSITFYYN